MNIQYKYEYYMNDSIIEKYILMDLISFVVSFGEFLFRQMFVFIVSDINKTEEYYMNNNNRTDG